MQSGQGCNIGLCDEEAKQKEVGQRLILIIHARCDCIVYLHMRLTLSELLFQLMIIIITNK